MNKIIYILIALSILISCSSSKTGQKNSLGLDMNTYYIEKKLSFFDPYELTYANGKYQGYTYETWIRKPDNLKMIHETFKKIGYERLFERFNYSDNCGFIHDVWKPCHELIDSLIITYDLDTIESKYYREFWNRRIVEKNDSIVFVILNEVSEIVYQDKVALYDESFVNDTLFNLLEIREFEDSLTSIKAKENFEYLRTIGLHGSAYNLLYERYAYYDIEWNRSELKATLVTDTLNCCPQDFIEDDTK
jgi:hypothetical protein